MTLASGNFAAPLAALAQRIPIECAVPLPDPDDGSGGCPFPVDVMRIGDDERGLHQRQERGRVLLTWGTTRGGPPKLMHPEIEIHCTAIVPYEAHLWVPAPRAGGPVRLDYAAKLVTCVVRAIVYELGASMDPMEPPFERFEPERDPDVLRNGQAGILYFNRSWPITRGRYLQPFPPGTTVPGVLNINPEA